MSQWGVFRAVYEEGPEYHCAPQLPDGRLALKHSMHEFCPCGPRVEHIGEGALWLHCDDEQQDDSGAQRAVEALMTNPGNVWPELDVFQQEAMRDKARPRIASKTEAYGHMSDEWVANRARMLYRDDLEHEAVCGAARDRIMRLSIQLAEARGIIAALKTRSSDEPSVHPAKYGDFWYVEQLCNGVWARSAQAHSWALEADARQQCEKLRRRYGGRIYRVVQNGVEERESGS